MIPFINDYPNLLVIRTLSKDASLAGLRAGFAAGSAELIEGLCRLRDSFNSYTTDRLAQAAAVAAIADAAYYDEVNAKIRRTRKRITQELSAMGFSVIPSQANFIFASPPASLPDKPASTHAISAADFYTQLREKGILVRHFKQNEIANYLRISIGTDEEMDTLINACREIISGSKS